MNAKLKLLFLTLLFAPLLALSQIQGEDEVYLGGDFVEARFNGGGLDKFNEFLQLHFDYTKVTKEGKLEATFIIEQDGSLSKIKITSVLDIESATEFIRVLKTSPKWQPAKRGGKPISIEIKYPMVFKRKATK